MVTASFPARPSSVGAARRFCEQTLEGWGVACSDAATVVSELATNAVVHAGTSYVVELVLIGRRVRAGVADAGEPEVQLRCPGPEAPGGRGLVLVQALSEEWGWAPLSPGKKVWAEVAVARSE